MTRSIRGLAIASALRKEGQLLGNHGADGQYRDEVYRALREQTGFVFLAALRGTLGRAFTDSEIEGRIAFIRQDFEVEERRRRTAVLFRLGQCHAFRGQDDHVRHAAFATERLRSKIS